MPYSKSQRSRSFLIACMPPLLMGVFFSILALTLHPIFMLASWGLVLDAGARYREHILLCQSLGLGLLPTNRIIHQASLSWCRRHAAVAAGVPSYVFHNMGYRWYHILPKGAPWCFFKPSFYVRVLA